MGAYMLSRINQLRKSFNWGAIQDAGTGFVLWILIPIEVRIKRAGARKVQISARKIKWALKAPRKAEGQKLSAFAL